MSGKLDVSRVNKQSAAADKAMPDKTITVSAQHSRHTSHVHNSKALEHSRRLVVSRLCAAQLTLELPDGSKDKLQVSECNAP